MIFSNLFSFAGGKLIELNNLCSTSKWARYIIDMVKMIDFTMHCGYIEDYITRCLQSGVRHEVDNRLIGLHSKEFIECLYASAKNVTTVNETAYIDSCYVEEPLLKATFDKDNIPELKTKDFWCKHYTKAVVTEKNEIVEEKFQAFITALSFKYNPSSKELFLTMKFRVQKWAVLGEGEDWTDVP